MYRLYVNEERTIKVETAHKDTDMCVYVATREHPSDIWGPPIRCDEEDLAPYQASTEV